MEVLDGEFVVKVHNYSVTIYDVAGHGIKRYPISAISKIDAYSGGTKVQIYPTPTAS
ncbi:MAG: hypothetical protein ACRDD8_16180 [Bacteroidales bacterium]